MVVGHRDQGRAALDRAARLQLAAVASSCKPCFAVAGGLAARRGQADPGGSRAMPARLRRLRPSSPLLLKSQPDIGMLAVVTGVFFLQLFVAGLNIWFVGMGAAAIVGAAVGAYRCCSRMCGCRVAEFLDIDAGDNFQIKRALEAFANGGVFGRGPGEGRIKDTIPDAHADFVFAVAGEEFGLVICLVILAVFAFIVLRGLKRVKTEHDPFVALAGDAGLAAGFGLAGLRQHGLDGAA
jgi:cell division protein FtsW